MYRSGCESLHSAAHHAMLRRAPLFFEAPRSAIPCRRQQRAQMSCRSRQGQPRALNQAAERSRIIRRGSMAKHVDDKQLNELLCQALETEIGGIQVYEHAIACAINDDLRNEFNEYLAQTKRHREVLLSVCKQLGLDPKTQTPGRQVVAHLGESLVKAIQLARNGGDPIAAELVACEC